MTAAAAFEIPQSLRLDAWSQTWTLLGAKSVPLDVHAKLIERYREPHRAYHTLQHLDECLRLRSNLLGDCESPAEIDIALWFHDAIYAPMRHDNEALSAKWLGQVATQWGLAPEVRLRLHGLVMATCHRAAPTTGDEALLVDVDLAILGADPIRFDEYEAQVRREFRWVPRPLYRRKRREVLSEFQNRRQIYSSEACLHLFEEQARSNLARSIAALA